MTAKPLRQLAGFAVVNSKGEIMRFRNYSLFGLMVFGATFFAWSTAEAHDALAQLNVHQVSAASQIVDFRQTQFVFSAGRSLNSDWGQVNVDVASSKLRRMLDTSGGYLNVVLYANSRQGDPFWVVENFFFINNNCLSFSTSRLFMTSKIFS